MRYIIKAVLLLTHYTAEGFFFCNLKIYERYKLN